MNTTLKTGTGAQSEKQKSRTEGPRQTYIPPAISYSEALEVVAGTCAGLKAPGGGGNCTYGQSS